MTTGILPQYVYDYFVYAVDVELIDPMSMHHAHVNIQRDSDFQWLATTCAASAPIKCMIGDGASGRNLFSARLYLSSFAGPARRPKPLEMPRMFMAGTTVTFDIHNPTTSVIRDLQIAMHGRKVFDLGGRRHA